MKHEKDGLVWHTFEILQKHPEVRHGYFTKAAGNLAFAAGHDRDETVLANIDKAANALGLPASAFVRQTHGDAVSVVLPQDKYQPRAQREVRQSFDAMLAPQPGVSMLIKVADCQAVLLYDPALKTLALVHSGWRGSVQNIIGKTVAAMVERGGEPGRMLAAVAPSLGPCCAEFVNYASELPQDFWAFKDDKNHFDFWAISRKQLTDCGLKSKNIEVAGICTKCSPDYFSYRGGDKWERFGLMAGVDENA